MRFVYLAAFLANLQDNFVLTDDTWQPEIWATCLQCQSQKEHPGAFFTIEAYRAAEIARGDGKFGKSGKLDFVRGQASAFNAACSIAEAGSGGWLLGPDLRLIVCGIMQGQGFKFRQCCLC